MGDVCVSTASTHETDMGRCLRRGDNGDGVLLRGRENENGHRRGAVAVLSLFLGPPRAKPVSSDGAVAPPAG